MIILNCNRISLSYGTHSILQDATFSAQETDKIGVVGINGAGKSTLIKMIAGILQPDAGDIYVSKSLRIGYLEQNSGLDSASTLWAELMTAFTHLIDMEKRLKDLEHLMSSEKDSLQLDFHMKDYAKLQDHFTLQGGYEYPSRVKGILKGLGFHEEEFERKIQTLSGGQKTRLSLAKLLVEEPDILLLDEPTNHLDIKALEWLEDFLRSYGKCVLLISHDRYFLDKVTNKTIEIEDTRLKLYSGNYTAYIKQKSVDREIQQKHFELQQKEIAKMEAFIEQQKRWNREKNIIAAESRQKAIDRMDKIDKPKELPQKMKMQFRKTIISGNDVLFVEGLSKEYPGKPLFKDANFELKKNEKVFILGPNGCGKSTLLKILSGYMEATSGIFEFGHKVQMGYYDQEQEGLDPSNTILEEVWRANEKISQTTLRTSLASFLFKGEDVFKPISVLSGGEKSRVSLLKLVLSESNLLILDEPTNHLDIQSREILEESLEKFEGTILSVSHDRYFINKLATRILEFNRHTLQDIPGGYDFYLEYKNRQKNLEDQTPKEMVHSAAKLERMESKAEKARQRKVEKQLAETEKEIEASEERLKVIEEEMLSEEIISDHQRLAELHREQSELNLKLENLLELWEALSLEKQSFSESVP